MKKYIDILWISYWLSLDEIKKAYLEKAMEYHPDRNHEFKKEAEEKMKAINSAWDYIRGHFKEYQNMNAPKTNWGSSNSNKDTKTNNSDIQTNWAGFKTSVAFVCMLTWFFANRTDVFRDIYTFFNSGFNWWFPYLVLNPYILSVGIFLCAGWTESKNKTWKRIIIWLIVLNLLIITYKVEKLSEADDFRYRPTQQAIDAYKKSSDTNITIITDPDLLLKKLNPVIIKLTDGSYNLQWNKINWAKKYNISYQDEDVIKNCLDTKKEHNYNWPNTTIDELWELMDCTSTGWGINNYNWPNNSILLTDFELNRTYTLFIDIDYWDSKIYPSAKYVLYTK